MPIRRRVVHLTTLAALCVAVLGAPSEAEAVTLHATPGFMRDLDIGANGSAFAIGGKNDAHPGNGWVYKWDGKNWKKFSGYGKRITVDKNGNPWLVNDLNEIWRFSAGSWRKLPGAAIDIDAGGNGDVFMLGTDNPAPGQGTVHKWNGSSWTRIGGYGERITVDASGNVWLVNGSDAIWRRTGTTWEKLPGLGTSIDANGSKVWITGVGGAPAGNGKLYEWNGSGWREEGGYGHTITVAPDGKPAVINSSDNIWSGFFPGVTATTLGYKTMRSKDGKGTTGSRPVLTLMVEYQDIRFRAPHDNDYFTDMLFDGPRNLDDYIQVNSQANMTLSNAGVIGPIRLPMEFECAHRWASCAERDGTSFLQAYADALMRPEMASFDFARYDRDRNGQVTDDELMVVVISAMDRPSLWSGGINRSFPGGCAPTRTAGVRLCSDAAIIAEGTGFGTLAHEFTHTLGTIDLYGARFRNNAGMTLMAGTEFSSEDVHRYYHLDPWHKIRLGWVKPRIHLVAPGGKTEQFTLSVPLRTASSTNAPLVLFDPSRVSGDYIEYFVLEFRNPRREPVATSYDANVADGGVVVWQVRQHKTNHGAWTRPAFVEAGANGRLDSTRAGDDVRSADGKTISAGADRILQTTRGGDDRLETDAAVLTVAPDQAVGGGRAWQSDDGTQTLRWLSDNSASPIRVRVLPFAAAASSAVVEVSFAD
jgi:M6 family metalloprotease-like protein